MTDDAKLAMRGGAVRLTMSARVANDLDGLQRTLGALAERMGHPGCASGCDVLHLNLERRFAVNEAAELNPQPLPPVDSPSPEPWHVDVLVPDAVSRDLDSLRRALAVTVGKLGCPACCSGFDIAFRRELDRIAVNEQLEVEGFGRFA